MTHLDNVEARLLEIFDYWQAHADGHNQKMDRQPAVQALINLLVPTRKLQPRIADIFERERRKIDELTQQQFHILKMLRRYRRAAIVGGAGTGKTLLAMEKAQQLADAGYRVLFLCFNRTLADWLSSHIANDQIVTMTYHGLVGAAINWAKLPGLAHMNMSEFSLHAADMLLDAASIIRFTRLRGRWISSSMRSLWTRHRTLKMRGGCRFRKCLKTRRMVFFTSSLMITSVCTARSATFRWNKNRSICWKTAAIRSIFTLL